MLGIIYPYWSLAAKRFEVSGRELDEDIRNTPRQGFGIIEIAAWLSNDVESKKSTLEWIKMLSAISLNEKKYEYLSTGNAHSVFATKEHIFIKCEFEDRLRVWATHRQIISVLENYIQFLNSGIHNPHAPPEPFLVEYEAEGSAALHLYLDAGGRLGWTEEEILKHNQ